jgi:hypothetical protein
MMSITLSSGICSSASANSFPNCAGRENIDDLLTAELKTAGIEVVQYEFLRDTCGEVKTSVRGQLHRWTFTRAWYYWMASGPGLPPNYATPLHEVHGQEVRVGGHCGCPSPLEWCKGFAVDSYHVDTPTGLKALADALKQCVSDAS